MRYLVTKVWRASPQDLGGDFPRRIQYMPSTGKVVRRILGRNDAEPIVREEKMYAGSLRTPQKASGDVELFGDFK